MTTTFIRLHLQVTGLAAFAGDPELRIRVLPIFYSNALNMTIPVQDRTGYETGSIAKPAAFCTTEPKSGSAQNEFSAPNDASIFQGGKS